MMVESFGSIPKNCPHQLYLGKYVLKSLVVVKKKSGDFGDTVGLPKSRLVLSWMIVIVGDSIKQLLN